MARGRSSGGGRIYVHQRTVDDRTQIIGGGIDIEHEHVDSIIETEQSSMENATRREYQNRLQHIYTWWMEHYPSYFEEGTRLLSEDERKDAVFFAHRNNQDLCYSGLNVTLVKAFLSAKKKKKVNPETGKVTLASVSDIKKYDDAIYKYDFTVQL